MLESLLRGHIQKRLIQQPRIFFQLDEAVIWALIGEVHYLRDSHTLSHVPGEKLNDDRIIIS